MYDYIVIGGGSAGCAVASRLAADKTRTVCLLEAGGTDNRALIRMPIGIAAILPTPFFNYALKTVPQKGLGGRIGYQPRGRAMGGSSAINAMIYIRGQREDFDDWAKGGANGWSYDDVLPYFLRAENNERGADAFHGAGGPLNVADLRSPNPVAQRFIDAAAECQYPINPDFNGASQTGIGWYQVTQKGGERWSAARAYIDPLRQTHPNLTIRQGTRTMRIVMDGDRASGVEIAAGSGTETLMASKGVILSAGAFHSPQLLMLSGIGPEAELQRHGIAVRIKSDGVGKNLHDHPDYVAAYKSSSRDLLGVSLPGSLDLIRWLREYGSSRTGMGTSNGAEAGGFLSTLGPNERPDVQIHFVVAIVDDHGRKLHPGHGFSSHICVLRPKSRGSVTLRSASIKDAPVIDPNFLGEDDDVQTLLRGFKMMREILKAPALAPVRGRELYTEGLTSDADLIAALRQRTDSVYHPVGTCKMGTDPLAVVDPSLRLIGARNLWVADASVMPQVVSGNTNAASIMIGERAADFIMAAEG